jgi:hypothetical protein
MSQSQSTGFQSESTTLHIKASQTGTSNIFQVALTFSHSNIFQKLFNITTQTKCSSRFKATQIAHDSNSTISLYATFLRPETLAIESPR